MGMKEFLGKIKKAIRRPGPTRPGGTAGGR
jgi:hypothetical protein